MEAFLPPYIHLSMSRPTKSTLGFAQRVKLTHKTGKLNFSMSLVNEWHIFPLFWVGAKLVQYRSESTPAGNSFSFCHTIVVIQCMCIFVFIRSHSFAPMWKWRNLCSGAIVLFFVLCVLSSWIFFKVIIKRKGRYKCAVTYIVHVYFRVYV